jgi:hypothetical protein
VLKRLKGEPSASLTACSLVFMLPFVRPIRRPRSPFTCKLAPCVAPYLNERPESERVKRALNVRVWVSLLQTPAPFTPAVSSRARAAYRNGVPAILIATVVSAGFGYVALRWASGRLDASRIIGRRACPAT